MRTPASKWLEVRGAYARGEGSLADLADRFGVARKAVQSRCLREGWSRERIDATKELEKAVRGAVKAKAGTIAEHAAQFLQRAMVEGNSWLDQIEQAKQLLGAGDIDGLVRLVRAWSIPIEAMRKIVNPEEHQPKLTVGVFTRSGDCVTIKSQVEGADSDAIDVS